MKTLTLDEAVKGLGHWVEMAVAGEQILIRKGDAVVELRPAQPTVARQNPREALRSLQQNARLTMEQADAYLCEVH